MGETNGTDTGKQNINNIFYAFADDKSKFIVKSSGLTKNTPDATHFNNIALREIGRRFSEQYINFISGVDFNKPTYINADLIANNLTTSSIKFPSVYVSNPDPDVLNDYRQNTFSSKIFYLGGFINGGESSEYVKIGRVVYYYIRFVFGRVSTTNDSLQVMINMNNISPTGPTSIRNSVNIGYMSGFPTGNQIFANFDGSPNTFIKFWILADKTTPTPLTYGDLIGGLGSIGELQISGFYFQ